MQRSAYFLFSNVICVQGTIQVVVSLLQAAHGITQIEKLAYFTEKRIAKANLILQKTPPDALIMWLYRADYSHYEEDLSTIASEVITLCG